MYSCSRGSWLFCTLMIIVVNCELCILVIFNFVIPWGCWMALITVHSVWSRMVAAGSVWRDSASQLDTSNIMIWSENLTHKISYLRPWFTSSLCISVSYILTFVRIETLVSLLGYKTNLTPRYDACSLKLNFWTTFKWSH